MPLSLSNYLSEYPILSLTGKRWEIWFSIYIPLHRSAVLSTTVYLSTVPLLVILLISFHKFSLYLSFLWEIINSHVNNMSRTIQHYQVCILYMFVFYETYHDLHVFGSLSVCSVYIDFNAS